MPSKDTFRREQRFVVDVVKQRIFRIKLLAEEMEELLGPVRIDSGELHMTPREKALAVTKLEEAVMWATKGWT